MKFLSRFVDSNDRELRRIQPWVDEANALETEFEALSDDEIRAQYAEIREEIQALAQGGEPSEDELHHPDLERRLTEVGAIERAYGGRDYGTSPVTEGAR